MSKFKCPACGKEYEPDVPNIDLAKTAMQREQHLSQICSDECWDVLYVPDEDYYPYPEDNEDDTDNWWEDQDE